MQVVTNVREPYTEHYNFSGSSSVGYIVTIECPNPACEGHVEFDRLRVLLYDKGDLCPLNYLDYVEQSGVGEVTFWHRMSKMTRPPREGVGHDKPLPRSVCTECGGLYQMTPATAHKQVESAMRRYWKTTPVPANS